jgi:hypothetical protein
MLDRAASGVLLVRSIEEADRAGELLPHGDREQASRETLRELDLSSETLRADGAARDLRHALDVRAERLLRPLELKYPIVADLLDRAHWPAWLTPLALAGAFATGFVLSALDGTRRVDILAFPFLGVIAWNLFVYLALATAWLRRKAPTASVPPSAAGKALARRLVRPLQRLTRRTASVHAALGAAFSQFVAQWGEAAAPLLAQRARRMFHLASATLALGLLTGLYMRGIALRYEAGWDSTFLSAGDARRVIGVVYGLPASLAHIVLPATDVETEALRWSTTGHGVNAAPWIHLIAVSLMLYVMLPRFALAFAASWREWSLRTAAWPPALLAYARRTFGATARGTTGSSVQVVPYACELDAHGSDRLAAALAARLGGEVRIEPAATIAYGDESAAERLFDVAGATPFDARVLLFSLAATPEIENHGAVLRAARDAATRSRDAAPLFVAIDESAFAARFGANVATSARLEERRQAWREFAAGHGVEAWIVDLGRNAGAGHELAPA